MTLYPGIYGGSYWPSGPGGIGPEVKRTDPATATPPKGEAKPKSGYGIPVYFGGASMLWGGETAGWVQPPRGTYSTYRLMNLQPTLAKARATYLGRLLSSKWDWKARDKASEKWLDPARRQFDPLRHKTIGECLQALTFGWRGGQKVWLPKDGLYGIDDLIFYEPDGLQICHYEGRPHAFAGITWGNADSDRLPPVKSFLFTVEGWGGNLYGQSYHEAAYDSWCAWNRSRWDRIDVGRKLAGIVPVMKYPHGTSQIDVNGTQKDNHTIALEMLAGLKLGKGSAVPNSQYNPDELAARPDLVKLPTWELDFLDAGNHAPAVVGIVTGQEYDDKALCRAWRLSERALIEATTAGSRADSEQHTETDVLQLEAVDDEIATQFNRGVVDDWLVVNFGEDARGAVYAEPVALTDTKAATYKDIIKTSLADPVVGPVLKRRLNYGELVKHLEIPLTEGSGEGLDEDVDAAFDEAAAQKEEDRKIAAAGAKPGAVNGNGKPNGRVAALSRGAAWLGEMLKEEDE